MFIAIIAPSQFFYFYKQLNSCNFYKTTSKSPIFKTHTTIVIFAFYVQACSFSLADCSEPDGKYPESWKRWTVCLRSASKLFQPFLWRPVSRYSAKTADKLCSLMADRLNQYTGKPGFRLCLPRLDSLSIKRVQAESATRKIRR